MQILGFWKSRRLKCRDAHCAIRYCIVEKLGIITCCCVRQPFPYTGNGAFPTMHKCHHHSGTKLFS